MGTAHTVAEIVNPLLSVIAMIAIAIYSKREVARRQTAQYAAEELLELRRRANDLAEAVNVLPQSLKAHFVERGEWQQSERSADHIHQTINDRIAAVEARR